MSTWPLADTGRTTPSRYSGWSSATRTVTRFLACADMIVAVIVRSGGRRGHVAESDGHGARLSGPHHLERQPIAGLVRGDDAAGLMGGDDALPVDRDDYVSP